jgi:hypothetical protein
MGTIDQATDQATVTIDQTTDQAQARRAPWAPGQKSRKPRPAAAPKGKRPLKLSITEESYERLALHGLKAGQTISEVVESLAVTHLNQWIIHAKPGSKS